MALLHTNKRYKVIVRWFSQQHCRIGNKEKFLKRYELYNKTPIIDTTQHHTPPMMQLVHSMPPLNHDGIFCNSDTNLAHIHTYGFDYDYTIAAYTTSMHDFIYSRARNYLVYTLGYSTDLLDYTYTPYFAVRGIHYDKKTGYMMKLDQYCRVQVDTVHLGRQPVDPEDTVKQYGGVRLTTDYVEKHCHMYKDMFSLSEQCLLADVIQWFVDQGVEFSPLYVSQDVHNAINDVHSSGSMYQAVITNPEKYLMPNEHFGPYLKMLRDAGRKLFLLTNSPFLFVNAGLQYLMRRHLEEQQCTWQQCFDVVVCDARKPYFFTDGRGFRHYDVTNNTMSVQPINRFIRGQVYCRGGMKEFMNLTGFTNIMYVGDQVYADLAEPQRVGAWKTAAVLRELNHEIRVMDTLEFRQCVARLSIVQSLIEQGQPVRDASVRGIVDSLKDERRRLRTRLKDLVNVSFGSPFRTSSNSSMFFYNVERYADLYTSDIRNFMNVDPLSHVFYSRRTYYPHEHQLMSSRVLDAWIADL